MKKWMAVVLVLVLLCVCVGCGSDNSGLYTTDNKAKNQDCSHTYGEATCTEAKKCTKCGETKGDALGHSFANATCTEPEKCVKCGEVRGNALGHKLSTATCTSPAKCSKCGKTQGSATGHNYKNWACTVCGAQDPNAYVPASQMTNALSQINNCVDNLNSGIKCLTSYIRTSDKDYVNYFYQYIGFAESYLKSAYDIHIKYKDSQNIASNLKTALDVFNKISTGSYNVTELNNMLNKAVKYIDKAVQLSNQLIASKI